jgi:hypothetical protein
VLEAFFRRLKRGRQIQYGPAMLNSDDTSIGKTATVPRTIHFVDDLRRHIAATQEIRMQRVRHSALNRMLRRGQRLPQNLTAENLCTANVAALTAKYVVFNALQFEECNQIVKYRVHPRLFW